MSYNLKNELDTILMSNSATNDFYEKYNNSQSEFKKRLLEVLPEVEDCKNQQQRTPWHNRDVLTHILSSVENMNKLSKNLNHEDRRLLSYVMFFHDLGKPKCHIIKHVDGEERDSFPGHNKVSCEIAKRAMPFFNFDFNQMQCADFLIDNHDFMIGYMRNKDLVNVRDIVKDFVGQIETNIGNGTQLMQNLIYVTAADNGAQNAELAKKPLKELDEFQRELNIIKEKQWEKNAMDEKQYYNYKTTIYRFMKEENIKYQCSVLMALEKFPELEQILKNLNNSTEFDIKGNQFEIFVEECKKIETEFNARFNAFFNACVDDRNLLFDLHNQFGKDMNLFKSLMGSSPEEFAKFIESTMKNNQRQNRQMFSDTLGKNIDLEKCIEESNQRSYS